MQNANGPDRNVEKPMDTALASGALAALACRLAELNQVAPSDTTSVELPKGEWLQALIDIVRDYIFIKDRSSRFVMANRQIALDLGFPDGFHLIGKTDLDLHPEEVARKFFNDEQQVMDTRTPRIDYEEFVVLPSGRRKWFASSKYPVLNEAGEAVGLVGISRDITERQETELLRQGQNRVLQSIVAGAPLAQVLDTLIRGVENQLDGVIGSVILVDDSGKQLSTAVAPNLPPDYVAAVEGVEIGPRVGSCGTAIFSKQNVFVPDMFDSDLWSDFVDLIGPFDMRSCWSVPFFAQNGEVLGTFGLYTHDVRSPTDSEVRVAEEAARLASIAVERERSEQKIRHLAHHDPLTGLPNRQELKTKLEERVEASRRSGDPVAVVFVDMDNFKLVNDSYGHATGDTVLRVVAQRIRDAHHGTHDAIRFGGDEFVLIIGGAPARKDCLHDFMASLREDIIETIQTGDLALHVTCSIGGAVFPEDGDTVETLLKNADAAMFEAKTVGRDSYVVYQNERDAARIDKLQMVEDMRSGIEEGQFSLDYQPQFDLLSGRIVGAEALVRWKHPRRGRLLPRDFIEIAEESGLIVPMGRWILQEACRQNRAWQDAGLPMITMGVNVSARQFRQDTLVSDIRDALDMSGLDAARLELELTETPLIDDPDGALKTLDTLREIGLKLAIDDFGTGSSSLILLKKFPLTRLKIDQGFIRDLDDREQDRSIVRAIISLGRELGLNVVAEGVETAKQQAFLASCRCETIQGYHCGRPITGAKFAKLLAMTHTPFSMV